MTAVAQRLQGLPRLRWHHLLLVLLALVAIVLLRKHAAQTEDRAAPVVVHGAVGQRLQGRNFVVQVHEVSVARALTARDDFGRDQSIRLDTAGVWLVLAARIEALEEPGLVGARLRTPDGLEYGRLGNMRLRGSNLDRTVVPGLAETGYYVVELPPDRLQGAHLELFWGPFGPRPLDSLVDVDLGIDAATARRLLAEIEPERDLSR